MKSKGFSRAKKVDLTKAEQFIAGADNSSIRDETPKVETAQEITNEQEIVEEGILSEEKLNQKLPKQKNKKKMPWDEGDVRISKGINLRLNEIQWLKLKYISENSPHSMQKFIMKALEPAINIELEKLNKTNE